MAIEKILILPDAHLTNKLPKAYKLVKRFLCESENFDEIVLLGDFMDISALSHWDKDKKRVIEGKRYEQECTKVNEELDFLQSCARKVTYLEGNHENFVERYLDYNPELEGLLEVPNVLSLKARGIDWIPMNDLYKIGKCYFTHGMFANKYHANKHLQTLGCNIVYGHVHRVQQDMINMKMQDTITATALGCLCGHRPSYMRNRPANWMNGFGIMYVNTRTGNFNLYPINIINNKFIFEGVEYK